MMQEIQANGSSDYEQRRRQYSNHRGVNYDFYQGLSAVQHFTPFGGDWRNNRSYAFMIVETTQPPLKGATPSSSDKWDINDDGVAHYGMLPDFWQDLRAVGFKKEDMEPLYLGAEAYLRMWEKAERISAALRGE